MFVCDTRFIDRSLQSVRPRPIPSLILHSRPEPRSDQPIDQHLPQRRDDCFTVAFVGQVIPPKGIDPLLEAARQFLDRNANARFIITGPLANNPYGQTEARRVRLTILF